MIKTAEGTGKTVAAARIAACAALGIGEDEGSMEVLDMPKSGFLGFGAVPARVRVTIETEEPELPVPTKKETPAAPQGRKKSEAAPAKREAAPAKKESALAAKESVKYDAGSREEKVAEFLRGLLERMDVNADVVITAREGGGLNAELVGDNMGAVIGRRGETLDAIQHLTNYALNRGGEKHMHISVDCENYRSKREESLARLAEKMAAKALKYKTAMKLEPMNSYERHVIHTALQNYEGVTTNSVGTEPNRRVVISCVDGDSRERSGEPRHGGRSRGGRGGHGGAPRERKSVEAPVTEEKSAAPAPAEKSAPVMPEGYEPPTKNKPTSREWC